MLDLLLGVFVGFVSSILPFGPGSLLVMRRGLEGRFVAGLAAAAGGAAADASYCALAVLGFSYVIWSHPDLTLSMRWVGAAILLSLGAWFLTRNPQQRRGQLVDDGGDWPRQAVLGFSLVAFNPMLILSWTTAVAVIASLRGVLLSGIGRVSFPLGVAFGDVAWAAIALILYRRLGDHLPDRWIRGLMRSIGLILLGLAALFAMRLAIA